MAKLLVAEYVRMNPAVDIKVIDPPLGSTGGLRALNIGKVDIVLSGRAPKANEMGQSKPWLRTPLVLATNRGRNSGLSKAQIADIFAGRKTSWDDKQPIRLVMRGEFESETIDLRKLSPEMDAAVATALKRPDQAIAENDVEALDTLVRIPASFGTSSLGLIKTTGAKLSVLPIDGIMPSIKTMENGSYPLVRHYLLISSPTPRPAVAALTGWLLSPAALTIARQFDYLPLQ